MLRWIVRHFGPAETPSRSMLHGVFTLAALVALVIVARALALL